MVDTPEVADSLFTSRSGCRLVAVFVAAATSLLLTGAGFLPNRVLLPLDMLADLGAWKNDPTIRRPVSNRLLSDTVVQFHVWDTEVRRLAVMGEFPFTNRFAGNGSPLLANPQVALFSPFTWPRLLLGTPGWAFAIFLKFLVAALGMFFLVRVLAGGCRAASISSVLFASSGFTVVWGLYPLTNVYVFVPWFAGFFWRTCCHPTRTNAASTIAFAALMTAGGSPEALAINTIGIFVFVFAGRHHLRLLGASPRSWMLAWIGSVCGFLLLAFALVPFLVVTWDRGVFHARSASPIGGNIGVSLLSQVLPGAFGSPLANELDLTLLVPGQANFNVRTASFVGASTLLLLCLSFARLDGLQRRALIIAGCALLLSWRLPLVRDLVKAFPLTSFIAQQYFGSVFVLFATLVAGRASMMLSASTTVRRWAVAFIITGAVLLAVAMTVALPPARSLLTRVSGSGIDALRKTGALRHSSAVYAGRIKGYLVAGQGTALRRAALPGICWLIFGVGMLAPEKRRWLLVAGMLGETLAHGWGYLPAAKLSSVPSPSPVLREMMEYPASGSWLLLATDEVLPPNLATLYGLRDIRSYDALSGPPDQLASIVAEFTTGRERTLSATGLGLLAQSGVAYVLARWPPAGIERIGGSSPPGVGIYRVPNSAPVPLPKNSWPRGLGVGITLSVLALTVASGLVLVCEKGPPRE